MGRNQTTAERYGAAAAATRAGRSGGIPQAAPVLTLDDEVHLQRRRAERVLAAAEVEAFVLLGDVEDGQLDVGSFHGHGVLGSGSSLPLLLAHPPRGVGGRERRGLGAGQGHAGRLHGRGQRIAPGVRRPLERRTRGSFLVRPRCRVSLMALAPWGSNPKNTKANITRWSKSYLIRSVHGNTHV